MTVIFQSKEINRDKLKDIIFQNPRTLQSGLTFIDRDLSTGSCGVIDFLGIDDSERFVIVHIDIEQNVEMLVYVLAQLHWLKKNEAIMKRLLVNQKVDFNNCPSVLIVAPAFSERLKEATKEVQGINMKFMEYTYLIGGNDDAIVFEEVFHNRHYVRDTSPMAVKHMKNDSKFSSRYVFPFRGEPDKALNKYKYITLSIEEIGEFMDSQKNFAGKKD